VGVVQSRFGSSQAHGRHKKQARGFASIEKKGEVFKQFAENRWCPGPESNRHASRRGILSPLRLPISPPGHGREDKIMPQILAQFIAVQYNQFKRASAWRAQNTKIQKDGCLKRWRWGDFLTRGH
jgi:hypothetical protein